MRKHDSSKRSDGPSQTGETDWTRVRAMSDEEIERAAAADPDNPLWTDEEMERAELLLPSELPKVPISIRLDPEVIDFFKRGGPGYQSRIGAVLLAYVRSKKRAG